MKFRKNAEQTKWKKKRKTNIYVKLFHWQCCQERETVPWTVIQFDTHIHGLTGRTVSAQLKLSLFAVYTIQIAT